MLTWRRTSVLVALLLLLCWPRDSCSIPHGFHQSSSAAARSSQQQQLMSQLADYKGLTPVSQPTQHSDAEEEEEEEEDNYLVNKRTLSLFTRWKSLDLLRRNMIPPIPASEQRDIDGIDEPDMESISAVARVPSSLRPFGQPLRWG